MKNPLSRAHLSKAAILFLTLSVSVSVVAQTIVFPGRVVAVADGDTVTVLTQSNTQFQVRCRGINAPKGPEDFASPSRQRLTNLLLDEPVTVHAQRSDDGALVGTIVWNERDICLDQVRAGLARYDDQSEQPRSTQQQYARAESAARNNRVGLWGAPALQTNTSLPASVVAAPETSTSANNTTVNVQGYYRKDGTYVPGYKRTAPDSYSHNNWSTQGSVNPYTGQVGTKRPSRWITALKWVGFGATLGALMYLDAKYPTATARCNDGTYSYSRHRQGTCSYHRGVWYWLR